jgi:plasmid stabilization system protein ParE
MSRYRITRRADLDLAAIWDFISENNGPNVADRVESELHQAMGLLGEHPGMGHRRADVRRINYRFWSVYGFVIAYRFDKHPIVVARVVHGARNFRRLFR